MTGFSIFDVILVGATIIAGFLAARRGWDVFRAGIRNAIATGSNVVVLICLGLLSAGFVAEALPSEALAHFVGRDSGLLGIMIAAFAGAFVPGGPVLSFPLLVTLAGAGAGAPQLLAFITGWSTLGFNRMMAFEVPILGFDFVKRRLLPSYLVAVLVGVLWWVGSDLFPALFAVGPFSGRGG